MAPTTPHATPPNGESSDAERPKFEGAPPRLTTCLNAEIEAVHPEQAHDYNPHRFAFPSAEHLSELVDWIVRRVESFDLDDVWTKAGGQHPNEATFNESQKLEEQWAKLVEGLFWGTAYGGPDIVAGPEVGTSGQLFGRFGGEVCRPVEPKDEASAKKPVLKPTGTNELVEDPAYSLFITCQHLTTYGALSRGIRLYTDLNGAGMAANQSTAGTNLFQFGQGGTWYCKTGTTLNINGKQAKTASAPADPHQVSAVPGLKDGTGAGTVYTYNPIADKTHELARVGAEKCLRDADGHLKTDGQGHAVLDPKQVLPVSNEIQSSTRAANAALQKWNSWAPPGWKSDPSRINANDYLGDRPGEGELVVLPLRFQFDGSHIAMVLRNYLVEGRFVPGHKATETDKVAVVQMLDANPHSAPTLVKGNTKVASWGPENAYHALEPIGGKGIFAGEAGTTVPHGSNFFIGLGTLPPLRDTDIMFENMRRARPVGFARLVITVRRSDVLSEDDIVYVSSAIPTWGEGAKQNFTLACLMWSLRNTPYRRSLQAHWVVYAPRGHLAAAMWREGARSKRMWEIIEEANGALADAAAKKPGPKKEPRTVQLSYDALCVAVISHDTQGYSIQSFRGDGLAANFGAGAMDKTVKELFAYVGPPTSFLTRWDKQARDLASKILAEKHNRHVKAAKELEKLSNKHADAPTIAAAQASVDEAKAAYDALVENGMGMEEAMAELHFEYEQAGLPHTHPLWRVRQDPMQVYFRNDVAPTEPSLISGHRCGDGGAPVVGGEL